MCICKCDSAHKHLCVCTCMCTHTAIHLHTVFNILHKQFYCLVHPKRMGTHPDMPSLPARQSERRSNWYYKFKNSKQPPLPFSSVLRSTPHMPANHHPSFRHTEEFRKFLRHPFSAGLEGGSLWPHKPASSSQVQLTLPG